MTCFLDLHYTAVPVRSPAYPKLIAEKDRFASVTAEASPWNAIGSKRCACMCAAVNVSCYLHGNAATSASRTDGDQEGSN